VHVPELYGIVAMNQAQSSTYTKLSTASVTSITPQFVQAGRLLRTSTRPTLNILPLLLSLLLLLRGSLRSSTRPTLNLLLLPPVSVRAFTLTVCQAPNSVECWFSMTFLSGYDDGNTGYNQGNRFLLPYER